MSEKWKDVVGYECRYMVSSYGNVFSVKSNRLLVPQINGRGYLLLSLHYNGKQISKHVHELVANSFIGLRPKGSVIDHKNGIKTDNRADNLQYISQRENTLKGKSSALKKNKSSNFNGVCWDSYKNKWLAQITYKCKNVHLLRSDNEYVCGMTYQQAKLAIDNNEFDSFILNLRRKH